MKGVLALRLGDKFKIPGNISCLGGGQERVNKIREWMFNNTIELHEEFKTNDVSLNMTPTAVPLLVTLQ